MSNLLKAPDFITKDGNELTEIKCKVCGERIAGMVDRAKGDPKIDRQGNRVQAYVQRFTRFHNFAELKMSMSDGSMHVTTGCSKCLQASLTPAMLKAMMVADIEEQRADLGNILADRYVAREPTAIVGRRVGGGIS